MRTARADEKNVTEKRKPHPENSCVAILFSCVTRDSYCDPPVRADIYYR